MQRSRTGIHYVGSGTRGSDPGVNITDPDQDQQEGSLLASLVRCRWNC